MIDLVKISTIHKVRIFRNERLLVKKIGRCSSFRYSVSIRCHTSNRKGDSFSPLLIKGHFVQSEPWRGNCKLHISRSNVQGLAFPDEDIPNILTDIHRTAPDLRIVAEFQLELTRAHATKDIDPFQWFTLPQIYIEAFTTGSRLP
ncbi:hypothetical protein D3C76_1112890 [compost metagenome]